MADLDASVVIPARNAAAVLPTQLAALGRQDFGGTWEVVVIDDGSIDGTAEVAARSGASLPGFRVITSPSSLGAGSARNLGAQLATGAVLAFCDADDAVSPGWLSALVTACRDSAAATGPLEYSRLNPARRAARQWAFTDGPLTAGRFVLAAGGCLAVRRDVFDAVGGFDPALRRGEDADLAVRIQQTGHELAHVAGAVVSVRLRAAFRQQLRDGISYAEVIEPLLPRGTSHSRNLRLIQLYRRLADQPRGRRLARAQTKAAFEIGRAIGRLRRATRRDSR